MPLHMLISRSEAPYPFFTWLLLKNSIHKSSLHYCCFLPNTILLQLFPVPLKFQINLCHFTFLMNWNCLLNWLSLSLDKSHCKDTNFPTGVERLIFEGGVSYGKGAPFQKMRSGACPIAWK